MTSVMLLLLSLAWKSATLKLVRRSLGVLPRPRRTQSRSSDGNEKIAVLKSEFEALKYRMAQLESRINPLEELRGVVMRGVWSVVGVVGLALVGLVLAK